MATINMHETYWHAAFWAMLLSPVNPDGAAIHRLESCHFQRYPAEVQSLAGGVFNEATQFGNAVGLAVTAAIVASVTEHSGSDHTDALMQGYRAAFWTVSAATASVIVVTFFGLRKGGFFGKKDE
ncbi:hypothetical protein EPUS_06886 [Endocarpon pusillum Z07020]|uniref:Major facilitator superfamily (MFS) profile domain-containing protein n=1 Tax=Endocarpon pusillum (strain Z07020 / HMAS-L-300199) TaxID=1263415 RepID=U1GWY9_ENDPU|nr:uncharacterized protein EPUS_06886 [Endocarpon pusillum Z07020]ERF77018.1 hypothetical protein EPUS_06886 [Endocarpon pusillum Z07020]